MAKYRSCGSKNYIAFHGQESVSFSFAIEFVSSQLDGVTEVLAVSKAGIFKGQVDQLEYLLQKYYQNFMYKLRLPNGNMTGKLWVAIKYSVQYTYGEQLRF